MEAAMDLMRRISPNQSETALSALLTLLPNHSSELLSQVDQPLQVLFFPPPFPHSQNGFAILFLLFILYVLFLFWLSVLCIEDGGQVWLLFSLYKKVSVLEFILRGCQLGQLGWVLMDAECAKEFILCEYNRDADSYRSPWSNKYYPPLEDGSLPSTEMRKLEIEANDVFAVYRDQYYEGGVSSVYMWEDDPQGFVACFLIKKDGSKTGQGRRGHLHEGSWEAIHVIEVGPEEDGKAHYCLTSTIMLSLTTEDKPSGTFNLAGSIRRQMNYDFVVADGHICNMGKMIEEMEGKLRNSLDQVYFGKTREMVCTLRPPPEGIQMKLPDK